MQPHYIFFPDDRFILAVSDSASQEVTLIHALDTEQRLALQGSFAEALNQQLTRPSTSKSAALITIEKQHPWLQGLASASLTPFQPQRMVIGDELGLLFLEITDQCNEQCIHCYASSSPSCSAFLSLEDIQSVLTQARQLGRAMVQFTGGDPLIHKHLLEAVAFADSLDFQGIEIYTNGLLLSQALLEKLRPFQAQFAFSLYSSQADVHDGITQVKASWKKTVAAIHRAQNMGFDVRIGMAVMQQNAGHEQAMLDFVDAEFGLDRSKVRFDPVHETGRGSNLDTKHISLMPSQNSHMPDQQVKAQAHHQVVQHDKATRRPSHGVQRRGKLAVCANGAISPCIFNREHVLGNIYQQSLADALASRAFAGNQNPSVERWNFCQHNLSCADCQMVAYTLGEGR
jgi:MoaA/NifB/PqqE/SkfB family radical SAM enzyme